ncbi:MAG: DUF3179 domain-containing protein [Bacteroidetes bacterium]|nr:DUF3179 domain-containing protein [Bacteroidota bacterium]
MRHAFLSLSAIFMLALACKEVPKNNETPQTEVSESTEVTPKNKRPIALENGKIFEQDGKKWLYGGEDPSMHFDITDCTLKDENYHYGIGREAFPALLEPQFTDIATVDTSYKAEDRFLVLHGKNEIKAYSVRDLTHYEVVNDVVDGQPVMAAYCVLADLGAIYDRVLYGKEFTFALTGYTYFDEEVWDGMDGFMLWDRETESMWWPLTGKAVSGKMKGADMKLYDETQWEQTTWSAIKEKYPNAKILISNQDFERPKSWPQYTAVDLKGGYDNAVAPKWGEK